MFMSGLCCTCIGVFTASNSWRRSISQRLTTLRPRQNGRHFPDGIFKCIFLNNNVWISIKISLKFVPNGLINNIPSLVQIKDERRSGDKPSSEPMVVRLLAHICVSRLQWVKSSVARETGSYDTVFDMIMAFVVLNNDIKEQLWCLCKIYSLCIYIDIFPV